MKTEYSNKTSILLFSRGRGHGHAIPDMEIHDELKLLHRDVNIQFVSYATGVQTFRSRGRQVIDMELPENNGYLKTLDRAFRLIVQYNPDIVIAHEEFAAIAAAKLANVPSIFISAWLPAAGSISAESLLFASAIVIIENPGVFPMPPGVTARVYYSGPIARKMKYTWKDRLVLRREMGIEDEALAVLVVPGGWATEERAPIVDTVLSAFFALKQTPKHLIWLAGKDSELLSRRTQGISGVRVIPFIDPVERLIAPCDVIITKGTRGITLDAASVGVPSISLSPGLNPIDDMLVPRMRTNIALNARAVNGAILQQYIEIAAASRLSQTKMPETAFSGSAKLAANHICDAIKHIFADASNGSSRPIEPRAAVDNPR